jgi:hypothetical protein
MIDGYLLHEAKDHDSLVEGIQQNIDERGGTPSDYAEIERQKTYAYNKRTEWVERNSTNDGKTVGRRIATPIQFECNLIRQKFCFGELTSGLPHCRLSGKCHR